MNQSHCTRFRSSSQSRSLYWYLVVAALGSQALSAQNVSAAPTAKWSGFSASHQQTVSSFLSSISPASGEQPRVVTSPNDGALIFLGAAPGNPIPVHNSTRSPMEPRDTAKTFLSQYGAFFHENDPRIGFEPVREKISANRSYIRMNQTFGGVPVFGAYNTVQCTADGSGIEAISSDIMRSPNSVGAASLNLSPTLSIDIAKAQALKEWQKRHPGLTMQITGGALQIYSPSVVGNGGDARLVWNFTIYGATGGFVEEVILWDAHLGELAFNYTLIHDAKNRQIYDSNNTPAAPGTLTRAEGQAASSITDVNLAYDYFGHTYDFYFNTHGRDSINGAGMPLSATTRYCDPYYPCPYANAFWSGFQKRMYFGQGFAAADDVVGHELTHGVTSAESGLIYANQSGAINESFSDMWGEWIDQTNGAGTDTPAVKWKLGEDVPGFGALRDMAHPPTFGDPDRMGSPLFYRGSADNGGVHWNSGVGNKLCFLLTDGGTFNGKTVTPFGITKTAQLMYEVQTNLLFPAGDYTDFYLQLKQAAINLSFSLADQNNLEAACQAVEIHNVPPPPVNDNFVDATAILDISGTALGTNIRATRETGEPLHAGLPGGRSAWWKYTAPATGLVSLNTNGSNFDTMMAVYTGASVGALNSVAFNDDSPGNAWSRVTFSVTSGTAYMIAVDGYAGSSGEIKLNYTGPIPAAPSNDLFAGARAVSKANGSVLGSNDGATTQTGEPVHAGIPGGKSVWWTYTAELPGPVTINTNGSAFDTVLAVYTGTNMTSLTLVAANDNFDGTSTSQVSFEAPIPTQYRIAVDGVSGAVGDITLNFNGPGVPAPGNDNFSSNVAMTGSTGNLTGSNVNASKETGEPNHGDKSGGKSAWWSFTPQGAGSMTLSTLGSNYDTVLAVYTGSSVDALVPVTANDDNGGGGTWSFVNFSVESGMKYYIAVDGFNGAYGNIALNYNSTTGGGGGGGEGADLVPVDGNFQVLNNKLKGGFNVQNNGTAISGKSTVDVYFSPDGTLPGATLIKTLKLAKMKPAKTKKMKVKGSQNLTWSGGSIIIVVDPSNLVTEASESNNTLIYGPMP